MIPAETHVVDKVPVLGSGKLDYVGVTNLVRDALAQNLAEVEMAGLGRGIATGNLGMRQPVL
jgi:acyl-[acyl-carrier-protein]-phospholipid O-acyltransferase / long-chain-fatty-acid--[acyl-carrier-protein] ligase